MSNSNNLYKTGNQANTKRPSKFTFTFEGVKFTLPGKFYNPDTLLGVKESHIYVSRVAAAKMIKQYVNAKYPDVVVNAKSESYSGGSSARGYISDKYGNPVSSEIYKDISNFAKMFEYGSFDGMTDSYGYNNNSYVTEKGMKICPGVKYVFVENRPEFESVCGYAQSLIDWMGQGLTFSAAIAKIRSYTRNTADDTKLDKAADLVKEYYETQGKTLVG